MNHLLQKILLVDDEPNIIMSLDFLFRKEGYEVFIARNGEEALNTFEEAKPDVVILDIMMPDIDGYEVCKRMKATEHGKQSKIVFLSAKTKESDIQKGLELGADAYITKPFSTKKIKDQIKQLANN